MRGPVSGAPRFAPAGCWRHGLGAAQVRYSTRAKPPGRRHAGEQSQEQVVPAGEQASGSGFAAGLDPRLLAAYMQTTLASFHVGFVASVSAESLERYTNFSGVLFGLLFSEPFSAAVW